MLRIDSNKSNVDLIGVELGGAVKNVVGIAAGICVYTNDNITVETL